MPRTKLPELARPTAPLADDQESREARQHLEAAGLRKGMTVLELNASFDHTTRIMSEMVGPRGRVILHTDDEQKLESARLRLKDLRNLTYFSGPLHPLSIDDETADLTYSRGVLEYQPNPLEMVEEFIRVTRRGGKIVCAELDNSGLNHYPMPPHLEKQLQELARELHLSQVWDPQIGRKLYSLFHELGLQTIKAHLFPHHLVYGRSESMDEQEWLRRIEKLEELKMQGHLKMKFDSTAFRNDLLAFFQNPLRLSYSPLILVEGVKS
jgi:ubiquinone/menaquinone biosynthesis C-methylase UbiE